MEKIKSILDNDIIVEIETLNSGFDISPIKNVRITHVPSKLVAVASDTQSHITAYNLAIRELERIVKEN